MAAAPHTHTHTHTEMLSLLQRSVLINAELQWIVSLLALSFVWHHWVLYITSLSATCNGVLTPRDKARGRVCVYVCVCVCVCVCMPYKANTAYHRHAVRVQEANVKLVWNFQVGTLMMEPWSEGEKCLQSPVMPRHPSPSCSRRWSSAYN